MDQERDDYADGPPGGWTPPPGELVALMVVILGVGLAPLLFLFLQCLGGPLFRRG